MSNVIQLPEDFEVKQERDTLLIHIKEEYEHIRRYPRLRSMLKRGVFRIIVTYCGAKIIETQYNPNVYLPRYNDNTQNIDLMRIQSNFPVEICQDCYGLYSKR